MQPLTNNTVFIGDAVPPQEIHCPKPIMNVTNGVVALANSFLFSVPHICCYILSSRDRLRFLCGHSDYFGTVQQMSKDLSVVQAHEANLSGMISFEIQIMFGTVQQISKDLSVVQAHEANSSGMISPEIPIMFGTVQQISKDLSVVQAHEANSSGRIFAEAEAIPKRLERGITKRNKRLPKFSALINNYLLLVKSYVEGHSNVLSLCSHTHNRTPTPLHKQGKYSNINDQRYFWLFF